jgi:hypothetical protein
MLAAMPSEPNTSEKPTSRRTVLAVLGAFCAAMTGIFFWRLDPLAKIKPLAPAPPLPHPRSGAVAESSDESSDLHSSGPRQPMTREWFLPHLHSKFQMHAEILSGTEVELIEVGAAMPMTDRDHHIDYTSFSLVFKGPLGMPLASQIYSLDHETLGKMEMFLSPIGKYKDQVRYQAVFSRRV